MKENEYRIFAYDCKICGLLMGEDKAEKVPGDNLFFKCKECKRKVLPRIGRMNPDGVFEYFKYT